MIQFPANEGALGEGGDSYIKFALQNSQKS
jgi:hypothetical protein